jgi:4-hydroxy-2-oxoheptanedioate aldolase
MLFIGPNDLNRRWPVHLQQFIHAMLTACIVALLGYTPANYEEPVFREAIDKVVATAKKHRKKVGILSVDGQAAREAKKSFDFIAMSGDVRALQAWYRSELEIARL